MVALCMLLFTLPLRTSNVAAAALPAPAGGVPFVLTRSVRPSTAAQDVVPRVVVRKTSGDPASGDLEVLLKPAGFDAALEACWTTPVNRSPKPFRDLLVSWNVVTPDATGFCVELRVSVDEASEWSSWMYVGDWGVLPELTRQTVIDGGRIDTDYFRGERAFSRAQVRVRAFAREDAPREELRVVRLTLCFSNRELLVQPRAPAALGDAVQLPDPSQWQQRLAVPFRSQKAEKPDIAGRICSPTSVAMVLAFRGVDRPTAEVAARAFDSAHDIYGNWPRNVQAAFSFGVPGYVTRFASWSDVHDQIANRQPLVLSIVVKAGQLTGAPYEKTDGHLIVLTGFDERGDCCVNDPAVADPARGQLVYKQSELESVWLERGGTAYVLLPKP